MDLINIFVYFCAVVLPWVLSLFFIAWAFYRYDRAKAIERIAFAFFCALVAWFLASMYKYNFPNPRPFEVFDNLKPLFQTASGDAFPSGHATFMGALSVAVTLFDKRVGVFLVVGAIVVSWARVFANVHWPIDIIAGLLLGSVVSLILSRFLLK